MLSHLFIAGRCHSRATLFRAQSLLTLIHLKRSAGALIRENMLISNSAGSLWTGETRHSSSKSCRASTSSEVSGERSIPSEDAESLGCCVKESASSSVPRSGEVEEEEELEPLDMRWRRPLRDMLAV